MEKPRYEWSYSMDRDEWPFEIYDHEEARVVARCETKDDAKFLHSLLLNDEAEYSGLVAESRIGGGALSPASGWPWSSIIRPDSDNGEPDPTPERQETRES